jgi:hypothetical protein
MPGSDIPRIAIAAITPGDSGPTVLFGQAPGRHQRIVKGRIMTKDPRIKQIDEFKQAARQLQADDNEAGFNEKLSKIARHKPVDSKPEDDR